ncbi:MAG: hypothetical protein MUE85_11480 [Microscillaceae bacterium]|jgi:hypothetical protein|nr:hypothetical protein [Microscillaceae bacterium]
MLKSFVLLIFWGVWANNLLAQGTPVESATDSAQLREPTLPSLNDRRIRFLALEKSGFRKRMRFYIGDEFHFKLKGEKLIQKGTITNIETKSIFINGVEVQLAEIQAVVLYKDSYFLAQARTYLPLAGLAYFMMDTFNPVIVGRENLKVRAGATLIGSGLTLGGLLLNLLKKRTIRLNQRKYLKTIVDY